MDDYFRSWCFEKQIKQNEQYIYIGNRHHYTNEESISHASKCHQQDCPHNGTEHKNLIVSLTTFIMVRIHWCVHTFEQQNGWVQLNKRLLPLHCTQRHILSSMDHLTEFLFSSATLCLFGNYFPFQMFVLFFHCPLFNSRLIFSFICACV